MILCVCPNPAVDKFIYLDDIKTGNPNRINQELSYPGGKGVHVAMGIKELDEEVALLAIWGGETGQWIKKKCEARGIRCYGPEVDNMTRTCLTIKSNNIFNETELLGVGPLISQADYDSFFEEYQNLLRKTDIVAMSGSWPENSVSASYSPFIEKATALGVTSFIDCSGILLKDALSKKPFAVHINEHEGFELFGLTNPIEISLKLSASCTLNAITYGAKGLYIYDGNEIVHALSAVKKVVSTVGCGDCLMAGLTVAFKRNYGLVETAKLAAAAGAANCIRKELGMFYKNDVERLFDTCVINRKQFNKNNMR